MPAKKTDPNLVTVEKKEVSNEEPKVQIVLPFTEMDSSGVKYDPYEHVTVNGESRHFKRGVPLEVTVSEFLLLKTKFPTI